MKRIIFFLAALFIGLPACSQSTDTTETLTDIEIPALKAGETTIKHIGYCLSYNEQHEQANWVAYELTAAETEGSCSRTDDFRIDPLVTTGTADDDDYAGSGYDRGHLAPAADMAWGDCTAMSESFFYSNMSPQAPSFNRGIWKKLEDKARDFAVSNSNIYIVTGPILTAGLPTIGHNQVSIPEYYYKVILDYTKPDIKAIAFLMANEGSSESLESFVVSVDSIEVLTGIDFFPKLPDDDEVALEKQSDANVWDLTALKTAKKKTEVQESSSGQAVQCKGLTKKGTRCKRMTTDPSGYCWQHKKIYKK